MTSAGGVALYQKNGYADLNVPSAMAKRLKELNEAGELIDDVQLTENGKWLILWGNNGINWFGLPSDLEAVLKKLNAKNAVINSVTFNDKNEWIVITSDEIEYSSEENHERIAKGMEEYGALWAAHLTEDGLVLCYENGYQYFGNVPDALRKRLAETKLDVFRIKFLSTGAYFFADHDGNYAYFF